MPEPAIPRKGPRSGAMRGAPAPELPGNLDIFAKTGNSVHANATAEIWKMVFCRLSMKRTLLRIAYQALLIALITFVTAEALLLVFNDAVFSGSFYVFDPDLGFRVRSHAHVGNGRVNEFGFNDRDYPHERRPGTYRILFLSDSYNWMGGQECNYTALLERRFEAELGSSRVEVISAGYSQTHTAEQLALLKKFGLEYNPDLVVLGFTAENDFFDAHPQRRRIVYGGAMTDVYVGRSFYTTFLGQPLILRSRLLLFLRERWLEHTLFHRAPRQSDEQPGGTTAVPPPVQPPPDCLAADAELPVSLPSEQYLRLCREVLQFADPKRAGVFKSFEKYIFDSLLEMRDLLARRGISFIVAAYPAAFQVDPDLRQAILERYQRRETDYEWDRAQRILERFCRDNHIEFHDLLPVFREVQSKGFPLYRYNDDHWTAAGNDLAARYFFDLLASRVGIRP
jgi:hypothetical protein